MGNQKISKRTLDSGEQVIHHPPDDAHPEGKQVLVAHSALRDKLNSQVFDNQSAQADLIAVHQERIAAKIADQRDKGLPPDKSSI